MANFSSRGPRFGNGGLKPEVVAPGVDITAAQAAGTDLGGEDGDPLYTTISGTSMATPHVAGLAAIAKQAHPTWDGEQLKDAITERTVPVGNATGFDAGTGRVDALRTLDQDVFTDHASLPLGFYAWPHKDVAPTHTVLTYTNTADTPVTLTHDVAGEDGSADPDHAISLGADSVTMPAHGAATADVVLDPNVAAPGSCSDVVTATPDDGGIPVRTEVGYVLEPELYNLTVVARPRAGECASHLIALSGMDSNSYDMKAIEEASGDQSVTFRVPPGHYGAGDLSFGVAADVGQDGVLTFQPNIDLTKDPTVVLEAATTKRFTYDVDRPVVNDGAIMNATWASGPGYIGFTLYGFADPVYASPTPSTDNGTATSDLAWVLSQPELEALPKRGGTVAMRSVAAAGHLPWDTTVPELPADSGSWTQATCPRSGRLRSAAPWRSCPEIAPTSPTRLQSLARPARSAWWPPPLRVRAARARSRRPRRSPRSRCGPSTCDACTSVAWRPFGATAARPTCMTWRTAGTTTCRPGRLCAEPASPWRPSWRTTARSEEPRSMTTWAWSPRWLAGCPVAAQPHSASCTGFPPRGP